jgi:hypothetical protein
MQCPVCDAAHDLDKCQGHVDDAKRQAYAEGGAEARAKAKGRLRQCRRDPLEGQDVCRSHGGAAPRPMQAAEQRVAEEKLRKAAQRLVSVPVTNPLEDLLDLAGLTKGWLALLKGHVEELEELAAVGGEGVESIRAVVVLFERAIGSCRKTLVDVARLDIDARLATITETQIGLAMSLADGVLRRRGIDPNSAEVRADKAAEIAAMLGPGRAIEGVTA